MKQVALSDIKDGLSKYLRLAETEEIVITKHGKPAGILVGFASQDDWFDYKLEHDPRFLSRIARLALHRLRHRHVGERMLHLRRRHRPLLLLLALARSKRAWRDQQQREREDPRHSPPPGQPFLSVYW